MSDIEETLQERGARYGEFHHQAEIAQGLKLVMQATGNWKRLSADKRECLDMLANKIARILNGDPNFHDSWHDICGYTKLVADRILAIEAVRFEEKPLPPAAQVQISAAEEQD
jgi:hypothetical protein